MKKSYIVISLATLILLACSGKDLKDNDQNDGAHQHDDGSVHQNRQKDTVKQEEFMVATDNSKSKVEQGKIQTHDGHEHPHKH